MMVMIANRSGVEVGYLAGRYPGVLGHLYSPGAQRGPWPFLPYALDNGRYGAWAKGTPWSEYEWVRLLSWAKANAQAPLWAIVPDVVANREATIEEYARRVAFVRSFGFRPAFAVQNGMTFDDAPDDDSVLFLGGTTDWKDGAIEPWCARFPGRVHVGRVNAWPRLMVAYRVGAISVDGTGWFYKKSHGAEGQADHLVRFCEMRSAT